MIVFSDAWGCVFFFFFCRPLLPLACQSVRMKFLAVSPGVHTIAALTLMDVESGYSINLRWVRFVGGDGFVCDTQVLSNFFFRLVEADL